MTKRLLKKKITNKTCCYRQEAVLRFGCIFFTNKNRYKLFPKLIKIFIYLFLQKKKN